MNIKNIVSKIERHPKAQEIMDDLVVGTATQNASMVNNQGHEAQIKYLLDQGLSSTDILSSFGIEDKKDEEIPPSIPRGLENTYARLKSFLEKCRPDMHEPDEQGISAKVSGNHLDNAMGDSGECGEYVVILKNDDGDKLSINLASLIALARR